MPRPKNSEDKNRKFLLNRLKDMYGDDFDPIMKAAENAVEMQNMATIELTTDQLEEMSSQDMIRVTDSVFARRKECVAAWDRIAQYITPKLKAIEHSGGVEVSAHEAWLEALTSAKD